AAVPAAQPASQTLVASAGTWYHKGRSTEVHTQTRGDVMRVYLTALALLVAAVPLVRADDKKDEPKANLTVTATLVAKTTTYKLDLGGKTADDFKKELKDAEKSGKVPVTPAVEMTLELKNTGDKDVQVWVSGDPVVVTLDLKGPGAV